jgi:phosphopantothenoylcysteine synthetase/decarboxylase
MRFISANASGRTGAWLADKLSATTQVHALCSPEAALRMPDSITTEIFSTTHDLMGRMKGWLIQHPNGVTIHSAAVGDYAVDGHERDTKIVSGQPDLSLQLVPTPKILDHIREWAPSGQVVSFKAASPGVSLPELEVIARQQAVRSGSALVFANIIGETDGPVMLVDEHGYMPYTARTDGLNGLFERLMGFCAG